MYVKIIDYLKIPCINVGADKIRKTKSIYEVEDLNISKDEFIAPKDLSIEVDCKSKNKDGKIRFQDNSFNVPEIDF